jgi:serine-type D-Ala-D-Ala carboxypeptidase (penicillin-binding protein 5/6)
MPDLSSQPRRRTGVGQKSGNGQVDVAFASPVCLCQDGMGKGVRIVAVGVMVGAWFATDTPLEPMPALAPPLSQAFADPGRLPWFRSVSRLELFELVRQPPALPTVQAPAALLIDLDTGRVLWDRASHAHRAPASLTKVITALVAVELLAPDQLVTVPTDINTLPWNSTLMGVRPGERLSVRDLMAGMFLNSGNDAAITLSEAATSRSAFIGLMNAKVRALGMGDTHIINPVGLDDPGQVSSAADLGLAAEALEREASWVAELAGIREITIPATPTHRAYHLYNLNQMLWTYPGATGLKTGWTGRAGGCLITTVTRNGHHLLAVVLGSWRMFQDTAALLDYGFALAA